MPCQPWCRHTRLHNLLLHFNGYVNVCHVSYGAGTRTGATWYVLFFFDHFYSLRHYATFCGVLMCLTGHEVCLHSRCLIDHVIFYLVLSSLLITRGVYTLSVSMDLRDRNFTCTRSDAIQEPNRGQVKREVVAPSLELPSPRRLCLNSLQLRTTRLVTEKFASGLTQIGLLAAGA